MGARRADLTLRHGAGAGLAAVNEQGLTASVARFGPSKHVSYAMFSGAVSPGPKRAMKAGRFTLQAAPPGERPDLTGLSCRWNDIPPIHGLIVSLLVMPVTHGDPAFRAVIEALLSELEGQSRRSLDRSPTTRRTSAGRRPALELETRTSAPPRREPARCGVVARALSDTAVVHGHADRHAGRRIRPGGLPARGRREFGLPQIRRQSAHDARLHAGARRSDRAAPGQSAARQHRALRHASPARRDHDLHRAVDHRKQPRPFHRRRRGGYALAVAKIARAA